MKECCESTLKNGVVYGFETKSLFMKVPFCPFCGDRLKEHEKSFEEKLREKTQNMICGVVIEDKHKVICDWILKAINSIKYCSACDSDCSMVKKLKENLLK